MRIATIARTLGHSLEIPQRYQWALFGDLRGPISRGRAVSMRSIGWQG